MDMEAHNRLCRNLASKLQTLPETTLIQTHISTIIIAEDVVYKLKKPVDFGFLDYTTLEKRKRFCEDEVRINGRFAPGLYLGVETIRGTIDEPDFHGEGEILDYAVKMRRFEQKNQLDHLADAGRLNAPMILQAADRIAAFHAKAEPVDRDSEYGEPDRQLAPMLENFAFLQTTGTEGDKLPIIETWTRERCKALEPLIQKRKEEGFIRECHGDLHLHNMALFDGELIMFDAIEFNPFLSHIDVISDLAFLLMDLEFRGLEGYSRILLNRYLEITGDYEGVGLLDFYKGYRAMVRAKVAALTAEQETLKEKRQALLSESQRYVDLAFGYTTKKIPFIGITHGVSGSGKSTFASMLVEYQGAVRIRSDVERKRISEDVSSQKKYGSDMTRKTYERLLELMTAVTDGGYPAIVDATFLKQWQRRLFIEYVQKLGRTLTIFSMGCDVALMRQRVAQRMKRGDDVSEADLEVLQMQLATAETLVKDEEERVWQVDCSDLASMKRSASTFRH